ncbi:MAG: tryptophan-rich sensory protein [Methylocystis sp.]|jgi:benzodiazapine receptor|nr:tryptophan-rich sensory protein [Methylocystis sp.]MCA3583467.1 tryptophan-rich sensory protein [Methylocystis sp.]MCA3587429.1 tryptophan-rich sensory protein [Methylocystis sp.]MCA3592762.1 tryptophan-rich sensory protein [Methylocystis sp.]
MQSTLTPLIHPKSKQSQVFLVIALVAVVLTSYIGSTATAPSIPTWYAALNKPWFNPPNWLFPVAWTTLFLLMAFSFWRILRQVGGGRPRTIAIIAFAVQLIINMSWSLAFFAARNIGAGLVVAVLLVAAVAFMIVAFRRIDPLAGNVQLPYLAWVTFALVLNATLWQIN